MYRKIHNTFLLRSAAGGSVPDHMCLVESPIERIEVRTDAVAGNGGSSGSDVVARLRLARDVSVGHQV